MTRARTLLLGLTLACGSEEPTIDRTDCEPTGGGETAEREAPAFDDGGFLEIYAATGGFRSGRPAGFELTPDGREVLFLRSGPRDSVRNLYALDLESGQEREVLTTAQLLRGTEEELSDEERALRERLRLTARGITSFQLSDDGERILVPLSGKLFVVQRNASEGAIRELPSDGGYANDPQFSPDGRYVATVRERELWVIDIERGTQKKLTSDASETVSNGLAEFVAQEEMSRYHGYWWSPDSRTILFQQNDESEVETLFASNPIDPSAAPHGSPYPRAGTTNAKVRLGLVDIRNARTRWVSWDNEALPYLTKVVWTEGAPLTILVQDRAQQLERLLTIDPQTARTARLLEERDAAWLNLDHSMPRWITTGPRPQLLWSTEREGAWQLELRNENGELVRALTSPELGYRETLGVEKDGKAVWVLASADPTEQHVVRVPLEGEPRQVTERPGWHDASFGGDHEGQPLWVHVADTQADGMRIAVRHGAEDLLHSIRDASEAPPFTPQPEFLTVGERDYRAVVIRPRDFEEGRTYPVLLSVYAGPGYVKVRKGRDRYLREQWQADHGFIVVSVDGRGTPYRGREWERAVRGNLIDIPLADQVAGLQAVGAQVEELDLERVGVYGWSFGGYFSAHAVMQRPDVFRVGVAGAPVADWRDYDTHYTERFMGLPDENREGYAASSALTHAGDLERPLMIIHGTSDDNVYFVHALKMSDALMRAGAPHEFVVLAGSTHMVADPAVARALQGRIMRFLADGLR
ncbi:MAG: DPP IV N-terminal domain-containing protein [Deltaproteobacteria bacterium]|nr:DPP IV N-terminal domain-containing protein [Deltaproteobacteria bacterium]